MPGSAAFPTSHAGSLPRPEQLRQLVQARAADPTSDAAAYEAALKSALADVVARQHQVGISVPGDGEFGKAMSDKVDYGAWWNYSFSRLGGLTPSQTSILDMPKHVSSPGNVVLTSFADRRDWTVFGEAYQDPTSGITVGESMPNIPVCTAPLTYIGQDAIARDTANFRAALDAAGVADGFMTSLAPGSCARIGNEYYGSEEELLFACADAMREEYKAIIDAGLILQLDDPSIAENWDQVNPEPTVADYQAFTMHRIEALNHALRGLPSERIRFHLCWGSWHGPHSTDLPMRDIVELMLRINAGGYSFEAGNVRHEHEWKVWQDVALPEGKVILPGVVSHATNVIEHPELVADRLERFASVVGRDNVIASTDCGLGGRVHEQIAWAKLDALARGAELAGARMR